ncbi:MAG TPA: hypothetical protein VGR62_16280 [Candidatus Binatia bacterium]|jgi:hypothetical protein|nr:hypothetical protein [Candidatus Binatia bacterium]
MGATARNGLRQHGDSSARCSVCHKRKGKVHRSRKTRKLVCASCADRARMRIAACDDCGERKLIQARGRCYACYKRVWRSARDEAQPARRASLRS